MIPVHHVLEVPNGGLWHVASHRERRPRKARGVTPAMLAEKAGFDGFDGLPTICLVGDRSEPLRVEEWQTFVVPDGVPVVFKSRPMGGGGASGSSSSSGKAIGAAVAAIALAVIAPYAVGAIGAAGASFLGTVGALTTAGQIASAVLVAGGGLLLSHFMTPKAGGKKDTAEKGQSIYSVQSQGNRPRPQQTVPVGYGRAIRALDYAAPPFSIFNANSQQEWNLFTLGCGDYSVEELRIGDTTVWTSGGGVASGYSGLEVQLLAPGVQCSLFPTNVVPNTDVSSVTVPTGGTNTSEYVVNASATDATTIYLALAWSRSYTSFSWKGQALNQAATTTVYVDYAEIDDAGSQVGGWTTVSQAFSILALNGYRHTMQVSVSPARYKIRVRASGLGENNELGIIGISAAITQDQPGLDHYRIAVKRTAGADQQGLNGTWLSIQTRKVGVWNGVAFVEQATRNPIWAAIDIWSDADYGANQPTANIDLATMISLATFADQQGYTFDHWFTSQMDLDEALRTCLAVMLTIPVYTMDKLSATYDGERTPSMLFTDAEIVRGSLQRESTLYRTDFADGAILEYLDETTWRAADVRSGDGLNNPGRIQIPGVTNRDQATWLARRHAAETNYRRISVSFEVEGEAKLLHIGDMVRVSTSEPQTYSETLIAVSYNAGSQIITVDRAPTWDEAATSHWVLIRGRNGRPLEAIRCVINESNPLELVLNGSDVSMAEAGGVTLDATINRDPLEDQCSLGFSAGSARYFDVLLKEIRRNGVNRFTLSGVIDNPLVYDADSGSVSPLPTLPPVLVNAVPVIVRLSARMFQNGPNCMLAASWRGHPGAVKYLAEVSYDDKASWVRISSTLTVPTFQVFVQPADLYLRIAGVSSSGIQGDWAETSEITAPTILFSADHVNLSIGIDDLVEELKDKVIGDGSLNGLNARADALEARAAQVRLAISSNPADNALVTDPLLLGMRGDMEFLARSVSLIQGRLEKLRGNLIEAGLEVESSAGRARLFGIAELDQRVTQVGIQLDAMAGTLELYSETFVSGDVAAVINQLNTVRVELDSLEASLTNYVQSSSLSDTNARVTTLESDMDAAESAITLKASQVDLDGADARLSTAETSINALQGIVNLVTSANAQFADLDLHTLSLMRLIDLVSLLRGDQIKNFSLATNNLSAFQKATGEQIAQASINLAAVQAESLAQYAQLSQVVAAADSALASSITTLSAQVNHVSTGLPATLAALNAETSARASADTALTNSITSLSAQVNDGSTGLAAAHSAVSTEASARASADSALSGSLSSVSATVGGLTSSVVQFAAAEAVPGGYSAAYDVTLTAAGVSAGFTTLIYGGQSYLKFNAGTILFDNGAGGLYPAMRIEGGVVYIEEARIKKGAVSEIMYAAGSGLSISTGSIALEAGNTVVLVAETRGDSTIGTGSPSGKAVSFLVNGGAVHSVPIFMSDNGGYTNIMPPQTAMYIYTVPGGGTYTFGMSQNHSSSANNTLVAHIYKK